MKLLVHKYFDFTDWSSKQQIFDISYKNIKQSYQKICFKINKALIMQISWNLIVFIDSNYYNDLRILNSCSSLLFFQYFI